MGYLENEQPAAAAAEEAAVVLPMPYTTTTTTTNPIECSTKCDPEQVSIAWQCLSYEIKQLGGQPKRILNGLWGHFNVGTLSGILGPSGAGKTTLLNALAGNLKCNNSPIFIRSSQQCPPSSYFISQHVHENIIGELTVMQILKYAFRFKNTSNSTTISSSQMEAHITKIMSALMLPPDIASRPYAKCSGGEQKRIAIAQELMSLTAPQFLLLDEPTTGLDSSAAFEVMSCLGRLAQSQRITVIASIHAPNNETLHLFDSIYVLAKGGIAIFSGPPATLQPRLEAVLGLKVAPNQPAIEVLLQIACQAEDGAVGKLGNDHARTEAGTINLSGLTYYPNGLPIQRKSFNWSHLLTALARTSAATFIAQFKALILAPIIFLIYFLLLVTIFRPEMTSASGCYNTNANTSNATCRRSDEQMQEDDLVMENTHYLALVLAMAGFLMMLRATQQIGQRLCVFRCEHRNGWYSLGTFYWSSTLVSFLELNLIALFVSTLSYFLPSQHAADGYNLNWTRFGLYTTFLWLLCFYYQSLGQLIAILLLNYLNLAIIFCQIAYIGSTLFLGIYVKLHRAPFAIIEHLNHYLGFIYLTRGLHWAIFGVDRCQADQEVSSVLIDSQVDGDHIGEYITRVLVNVVIIRMLTLVCMSLYFGGFGGWKSGQKDQKESNTKKDPNRKWSISQISIDVFSNSATEQPAPASIISKISTKQTQQFNAFTSEKILIAWRHLTLYTSSSLCDHANIQDQRRPILRGLSGQLQFGTLIALMGTSGSGKTSLLKVLNGRCKTRLGEATQFYLSRLASIRTCFITQEVSGHLMPGLTAKQALIYASRLKNSGEGKAVDHEGIAMKWLNELDLLHTASTKVNHCSGGEQKRLAVALELTSLEMPNLICIDEPTSGLDSNSAEMVITSLHQLAHTHSLTIVASLHQPTTNILQRLDQLYILARGGVCIYSGAPGDIGSHLEASIPAYQQCQYPIEELIKLSCSSHHNPIVQKLVETTNAKCLPTTTSLEEQTQLIPDGIGSNRTRFSINSVAILTLRFLTYLCGYQWRQFLFIAAIYLINALWLSTFFRSAIIFPSGCLDPEDDLMNQCSKSVEQIEADQLLFDNIRYSHLFTNMYLFLILLSTSFTFYNEFGYFLNEHRNGWYSSGSFYAVKSLVEILPLLPLNLLYVYLIDIYKPVLSTSAFWPFFLILTLSAITYQSLAHCISLLGGGNLTLQNIILICTFLLMMLLGNFYIPISKLHYVYQFLSNFNICRFAFEGVMLVEYGFGRCATGQIQPMLYMMGIDDGYYSHAITMLVFNLILFRGLAICLLLWRVNGIENRQKRAQRIEQYRRTAPTVSSTTSLGIGQLGAEKGLCIKVRGDY